MEGIRLWLLILWLMLVLVDEGELCGVSSPLCYKNSTRADEDFSCRWEDTDFSHDVKYNLFMQSVDRGCSSYLKHFRSERKNIILPLEDLRTTCLMNIWIQKQLGSMICNSTSVSVLLRNSVKYSSPKITRMSRDDENLILNWRKPTDDKGSVHEIRWRTMTSSWLNETFKTHEEGSKGNEENYTLHLNINTVYEVQIRRRANQSHLWSDWSQTAEVPIRIKRPVVQWEEKKTAEGRREILLSWDKAPFEASVGGIRYQITVKLPCKKNKHTADRNNSHVIAVTYSEAKVTVAALNSVGRVKTQFSIPPVQHLQYCEINTLQKLQNHTTHSCCLEWYELQDGVTRPAKVNRSTYVQAMINGMKPFVRYYYFMDIGQKYKRRTKMMCPVYAVEGAPGGQPLNVNVSNITQDSAVLSWTSIPIQDQRGFLKSYVIWVSRTGHLNTGPFLVPANQSSFFVSNLLEGSAYTLYIAGQTKSGVGPNASRIFTTTSSSVSGSLQIIFIAVAVVLLLTAAFSFTLRRLSHKLLPAIPSPVISATIIRNLDDNQNTSHVTEEVHEFVLLHRANLDKHSSTKQSTLLQNCTFSLEEYEEERSQNTHFIHESIISSPRSYPNPNYKGQIHKFADVLEEVNQSAEETTEVSTPLYKSGLFFESRISENEGLSVHL